MWAIVLVVACALAVYADFENTCMYATHLMTCRRFNNKNVRLVLSEKEQRSLNLYDATASEALSILDKKIGEAMLRDRHPDSSCKDAARRFLCNRHIRVCGDEAQNYEHSAMIYNIQCRFGKSLEWPIRYA